MFYQRLIYMEDQMGSKGLMLKGHNPDMYLDAAYDGRLVAHDIIEHQNGAFAIGPVEEELEALGAIHYVRDGFVDRPLHLEYDITDLCEEYEPVLLARSRKHYADDEFLEILGRCPFNDEIDSISMVLPYLRRGFRKAERRFGRRDYAYSLFMSIENAVNETDWLDECYLGQELLLSYDHKQGELRCL